MVLIVRDKQGNETVTVSGKVVKLEGCIFAWGDTLTSAKQSLREVLDTDDDWKRYRQEFGESRYAVLPDNNL